MPPERTTIVIVDDDPIVRQALNNVLGRTPGIIPISLLSNGQDALEHASRHPADVYLIDLTMPIMDGLSTVISMRNMGVTSRLVLLTSLAAEGVAQAAKSVGADGFLLKTAPVQTIVAAVLGTAEERPATTNTRAPDFTDREMEILTLLCAAHSNSEIAKELALAESTVKAYISAIMVKLDVDSRLKAVVKALHLGIVRI